MKGEFLMDGKIVKAGMDFIIGGDYRFNPILTKSVKWLNWITTIDIKTCKICRKGDGQIRESVLEWAKVPPVYATCRCIIK